MAQLDVQPKKRSPILLWLLIIIGFIILLFFLLKGCGGDKQGTVDDSTGNDTSSTAPIAVTAPDTDAIDFNAPAIKDADITDTDVIMSGNDKYTIYSLGENILFASGSTTFNNTADAKLQQVAASLNKRFVKGDIRIYGSTDNTGDAADNKELGKTRAEAVKAWLISKGKVAEDRISVRSFGETEPVASNQTTEGQAKNRNVAIVAFPEK